MPSERVRRFYDSENYAIIGVSATRRNFARSAYDSFRAAGKRVYAIGRESGNFGGIELYDSVKSLPEKPKAIIIATRPENTVQLFDQIIPLAPDFVWLQQGSYDGHVLALADRLGINPIRGCVIMNLPGAAFLHRLHGAIMEIVGKGYK
jgi:hypothetical protein